MNSNVSSDQYLENKTFAESRSATAPRWSVMLRPEDIQLFAVAMTGDINPSIVDQSSRTAASSARSSRTACGPPR